LTPSPTRRSCLVLMKQSLQILGEDFSSSDPRTSLLASSSSLAYLTYTEHRRPRHKHIRCCCRMITSCRAHAVFLLLYFYLIVHSLVLTDECSIPTKHGSFEDSATSIYKQSRVQNCSLKQTPPVVLIGDWFSLPKHQLQHPSPATVSHEDAAGFKLDERHYLY
jgi:hypothetical protein